MGRIIILTGPSGCGKTEVLKGLLSIKENNLKRLITCTTRTKREGEVDGKDYHFISRKEFLSNIKKEAMLEYAEVYGNLYGSRKKDLDKIVHAGKNVIFTTDIVGALTFKKKLAGCVVIFIKTESIADLKKRLIARSKDSMEVINKRVEVAKKELKMSKKFDYEVVNKYGKLDETVKNISKLIGTV